MNVFFLYLYNSKWERISLRQNLFIGVDGGATKSVVRVEDDEGVLLGKETGGPASIRISVEESWASVNNILKKILQPHGISLTDEHYFLHAGMGLAGCEVVEAYRAFVNCAHGFATLMVTSDAHTACLGAHKGRDGAVVIVGTGVVGYQIEAGIEKRVGGWGFPHDDEGGGAWLGLEAVKLSLKWLDGRHPYCEMARVVYAHFNQNRNHFISWANKANSTAFAEIAPLVIEQSQLGDVFANNLLKSAARAVDDIGDALEMQQEGKSMLPCSLIGSIAPFLHPFLGAKLKSRLCPAQLTPDAGAILLVRNALKSNLKQSRTWHE